MIVLKYWWCEKRKIIGQSLYIY